MKIDVEGAEDQVFRGGSNSLRSGKIKHLMAEINGPRLQENKSSPQALIEMLEDLGFQPACLAHGKASPVPVQDWDLHPDHEYDRLFVHQSV